MVTYKTKQGDMLDQISYKHYGSVDYVNQILKANPKLASYPYDLPQNIIIKLPDIETKTQSKEIKLWD